MSTIIYYFVKMKEMYFNLGIKVLTSRSVPYWLTESNFVPQQINFLCVGFSPVLSCTAQGRRQVSKQDEASLERRRREALGGSGGMPPRKF